MNPRSTAKITMTAIAMASSPCPRNAESAVATRRMTMRTFLNCSRRRVQGEVPSATPISFGPYSASRRPAFPPGQPHRGHRRRRDENRADQRPGNPAESEAQRGSEAVAPLGDEAHAPDGHEEGAGAHHDRKSRPRA